MDAVIARLLGKLSEPHALILLSAPLMGVREWCQTLRSQYNGTIDYGAGVPIKLNANYAGCCEGFRMPAHSQLISRD
jgi:hypothetical protein